MTWKDVLTGPCLYRNMSAVSAACGTTERLLVLALKQRWRASTQPSRLFHDTRGLASRRCVISSEAPGHALPAIRAQSMPFHLMR
jgi:hypothetical protein